MKITCEQIKKLRSCYSDEELRKLIPDDNEVEITLEKLVSIPTDDACWLVSKLLTKSNRIIWAQSCAARAQNYAAATHDARAAAYASLAFFAADDANHYNARAAHAADHSYSAAYIVSKSTAVEEHKLAMQNAIELLK